MNIVMVERIVELSETKSRHKKLKRFLSNWRHVAYMSVGVLTLKVAAEQLVFLLFRS